MRKITGIYLLTISILLFSCSPKENKMGDFKLLPQPQEFDVTGVSSISYDATLKTEAKNGEVLPIIDEDILALDKNQGKTTLMYEIDSDLDVPAEGYSLTITDEQILIKGKDEAGLFYAFKTLEQLMVDAKDQRVNLPLCQLKDYPLLAYRSVHLDVKHHLEKTEYYYDLLDKFASYKINGIILEVEDKLKFKRQPTVASADALSIEEW